MKKRILCYGDSNTWGYMPNTGQRFPEEIRWTGVLAKALGEEYRVLENGMNGRTTVWDDPFAEYRNGWKGLGYAINSVRPMDLMIVMLGSNDLNYTDAYGYYKGMALLAGRIMNGTACYPGTEPVFREQPRLLLVSPIHLSAQVKERRPEIHLADKYEESLKLAGYTKLLAEEIGADWMDGAEFARAEEKDCLHMDAENHKKLGLAIAEKVKAIWG